MRNLDKLGIFMTLLKSKLKFSKLSKTKFVFLDRDHAHDIGDGQSTS